MALLPRFTLLATVVLAAVQQTQVYAIPTTSRPSPPQSHPDGLEELESLRHRSGLRHHAPILQVYNPEDWVNYTSPRSSAGIAEDEADSEDVDELEKEALYNSHLRRRSPKKSARRAQQLGSRQVGFRSCKNIPGDSAWPTQEKFDELERVTTGPVIKTVPISAVCYTGAMYDSDKCAEVTDRWSDSFLHDRDPSSIMSPFHQGISCLPLANPMEGPWSGLGYPDYVVQAETVEDVQHTVNFARSNNIRLVIKNTGHDFSGKSGGANAISIWTHHLKDITYIPEITATGYSGPAFKIGAGVQIHEIYKAASEKGLMVVGGEGLTVGYAGGYLQGGGHSPLSSILGMGADHVLSFDVVMADGTFKTADATTNPDLFWALRGGGGATFGVVTGVTVKAYPTVPVTTVTFTFSMGDNVSLDQWWSAVRVYFENFPEMAAAGMYSYFSMLPGHFTMLPLFAPKLTIAQVNTLMKPLYDKLEELGIECNPDTVYHDNFYDAWRYAFPQEIVGWRTIQIGSRLWPKQQWHDDSSFDAMFNAIRGTTDLGRTFLGFNIAPTLENGGNQDNSVNPAWRNTLFHAISVVGWDDYTPADVIAQMREKFTKEEMQSWRDVSPGAGSYLGESDINEPNFQQAFWGTENYSKLYALKQIYDPEGVFYAATAVGSENWTDKNSERRLCPSYRSGTTFF